MAFKFNEIQRERIYKHSHLNQAEADRLAPLMESAFAEELSRYNDRPALKAEKLRFVTEQYANRARVSQLAGVSPLNEDAMIFGGIDGRLKNLFESVSTPGNVIGMGNVANPMNATDVQGGKWNPGYERGTGDLPSYVFGLQNHIALHCIGFDLIPTIAVDTPKPLINYVDVVYGGGTMDDNENLPSYLEFESPVFTRSFITTNNLTRGVTEVIFIADTASTKSALKVRFMLGSTVHAAINAEVLATGTCTTVPASGTQGVFTWDNSVSVKDVVDLIGDTTKTHMVYIQGATAAADVRQAITSLHAGYVSATRTNIAEATTNNNSLGGMSRAQMEKGPKHKLNVVTMDEQLEIVGLEIEADTTNIQIKDMAAMGVNVISYLYTGVNNAIVQSLDEVILDHLYALGVTAAINAYHSQGINHSLYIDNPSNTTYTVANLPVALKDMLGNDRRTEFGTITNSLITGTYENQTTHNERLYRRILLVSEFVELQTRIAPADTLVASGTICAALKAQSSYQTTPVPTTMTMNPGVQHYGAIYGTIQIYKNPKVDFNDPRILVFRRGDDKDPGAKLLAYDLAASRQIVAEQNMAEKIRVWSRFTIADVGFYPELNYYLMLAINPLGWI